LRKSRLIIIVVIFIGGIVINIFCYDGCNIVCTLCILYIEFDPHFTIWIFTHLCRGLCHISSLFLIFLKSL